MEEERISLLEIKPLFDHAGAGSYKLEGWDKEHFNGWFCLGCIEPMTTFPYWCQYDKHSY